MPLKAHKQNEHSEERISEPEDRSIAIIQTERKRGEKKS